MENETTLERGMEPWDLKVTYFQVIIVLPSFYMQRVWVALQGAQTTFILECVVIIGEGSSRLGILSSVPPLSLFNMIFAIGRGGGFKYLIYFHSYCDLPSLEHFQLSKTCVLPSCTLFAPFVGLFVLLIIGKLSSFLSYFA